MLAGRLRPWVPVSWPGRISTREERGEICSPLLGRVHGNARFDHARKRLRRQCRAQTFEGTRFGWDGHHQRPGVRGDVGRLCRHRRREPGRAHQSGRHTGTPGRQRQLFESRTLLAGTDGGGVCGIDPGLGHYGPPGKPTEDPELKRIRSLDGTTGIGHESRSRPPHAPRAHHIANRR